MNIKEAKEQIKNAMTAYFTKNEFGEYRIPIEKQRPIFLIGAPGIGKTAIMEQVAQELDKAIVSYSMTHHTRQSALGLPFIETKTYGGKEYSVSEYTMSEIIASVYDTIEESGKQEGILFLDEINCVSETLAPSMLQFLQYKVFGRHRVPDGWIVVTAGNPPEYNNSVREFDIVTWDRLKRIDVEPEYEVWKEYAMNAGIHAAITTYLDIKKGDFYKIESTVDGKSFVTARGWSDLSDMIWLYEENNITVDQKLIEQYLQNKKIARDFAVYYDLFRKYRSDYQIDKILDGTADASISDRAKQARFDERLSLLGLLLEGIGGYLKDVFIAESAQRQLMVPLKNIRAALSKSNPDLDEIMNNEIGKLEKEVSQGKRSGAMSSEDQFIKNHVIRALKNQSAILMKSQPADGAAAFKLLKQDFDKRTKDLKAKVEDTGKKLNNMFVFAERVFGEAQEMVILVTELTMNSNAVHYISHYGCEAYFRHNKELLFYERQKEIIAEIEVIEEL